MRIRSVETLIDALDASAERYPRGKLCFSGFHRRRQDVSFCDIAEVSRRYACGLRRAGLSPGDLVGLLLSARPEFVFSFMGALRAGGVPVPLPTYAGLQTLTGVRERLAYIIERTGARYLIAERRLVDLIGDGPDKKFPTRGRVLMPEELEAEGDGVLGPGPGQNDLCLIQYTSGSTAAPRGVALTHRNVLAGLAAIAQGVQATDEDVWCSWLPLFHDMGLIGMICGIVNGISQYLWLPRSFIGNPAAWLQEFSRCGATIYAGPSFSYAHMLAHIDDEQLAGLDLSRWRIAFNGSEPVDPFVVERFIERFSPVGFSPQAMFPVYGLAEATLAVSFPGLGRAPLIQWVDGGALAEERKAVPVERSSRRARGVVSVGRAVPGHTVRVIDSGGEELPENCVGQVQVKGPAVMVGYYADPQATADVLHDGWLSTGDLGYVSQGSLFITGRAKEMIIVHGRKFYPQDVEQLVAQWEGVYRGRCVALGDTDGLTEQMIVAVETNLEGEAERAALAGELRSLISDQLGLFSVDIYLMKPSGLPRTSSGKYQRLQLRHALRRGEMKDKLW